MVKADRYITREMMRQALASAAAAARKAPAPESRLGDGECVVIRLDQRRSGQDRG